MTPQKLAIAALPTVFTVKCQFTSTEKTYSYLSTEPMEVNDLAIALTPWGYKIVTVVEVEEGLPLDFLEADYKYSFLVQKVAKDEHAAFMETLNGATKSVQKEVIKHELAKHMEATGISATFFDSIKSLFQK